VEKWVIFYFKKISESAESGVWSEWEPDVLAGNDFVGQLDNKDLASNHALIMAQRGEER
jgi:hypothetical protein